MSLKSLKSQFPPLFLVTQVTHPFRGCDGCDREADVTGVINNKVSKD